MSRKSLYSDHAGSYIVCITPFDVYVPSSKRCDGDVKPLYNLRCLLRIHFVSCARGMSGEDENGLSPYLFDFMMEIHAKLFLRDVLIH